MKVASMQNLCRAALIFTSIIALTPARAQQTTAQQFSAKELTSRALSRRAVDAAIWGMPIVSFDAMRQGFFRDAKASYGDIMYWSSPSSWKNQTTTPNNSTRYVIFFINTKDGPVVVDVPPVGEAALFGTLLDAWQVPLVDVGGAGEAKATEANICCYLLTTKIKSRQAISQCPRKPITASSLSA
jgi:hypothetical protein